MCLWPGYHLHHDIPKHSYSVIVKVNWIGEWCYVFSDESRFCLYASEGRTHVCHRAGECHLQECICPRHIGPTSDTMRCGGLSVTTWSHLVFLQGRGNSARSIAQIVDPVLFPFHRQEGGVLFQQDNTHPHTAAVMQHALRGIQQLTWTARLPDLSPIQHV